MMTKRKKRNSLSGFTLIELLIVIGIIAILAAAIIVAVSPGDQLDRTRKATVKAQMQSVSTAAYNCRLEKSEGECLTLGDVDLPTPIEHPHDDCTYNFNWTTEGRVEVWEVASGNCDGYVAPGQASAITY